MKYSGTVRIRTCPFNPLRMWHSLSLAVSGDISGEWMHYLSETYDLSGISFPGEEGESLLQENLDFMLRFWKREGYFA